MQCCTLAEIRGQRSRLGTHARGGVHRRLPLLSLSRLSQGLSLWWVPRFLTAAVTLGDAATDSIMFIAEPMLPPPSESQEQRLSMGM